MRESDFFKYVDSLFPLMENEKAKFYSKWNGILRAHFNFPDSFEIENYLCDYGGFRLSHQEYGRLNTQMISFLEKQLVCRDKDNVFLRGYRYYACDQTTCSKEYSVAVLLKRLYYHFKNMPIIKLNVPNYPFLEWVSALTYLEYIMNNLSSIYWLLYCNSNLYIEVRGKKDYSDAISLLERYIDRVASLEARLLNLDYCVDAEELILSDIRHILKSDALVKLLHTLMKYELELKPGSVRSVREGDALHVIYAAYIIKFSRWFSENREKSIVLISNGFGGLNLGAYFYNLAGRPRNIVATLNINASHRNSLNSGDFSNNHAEMISDLNNWNIRKDTVAIVVDDSVVTGGSYRMAKDTLAKHFGSILFLPITFDISAIKLVDRDKRGSVSDKYIEAKASASLAESIGNSLPAFCSFWDWSDNHNSTKTDDEQYAKVLDGGDMQLKDIWRKYKQYIYHDGEAADEEMTL